VARITQIVTLLVLARVLAPSEFGILAVAGLTYNVVFALTHFGVADALTYFKDRVEEATRTALTMMIVGALILTAAAWALAPLIAGFFHSTQATFVLRGFALSIPFDAIAAVPTGRLTRNLSFARRAVTDSLPSVIGAVITIGVVTSGYPLVGLVVGQIAGSATNLIVALLVAPRRRPGWDTGMARQLIGYGGYLGAADVSNLALLNVDYILVGHVLGPYALGLYSLAYRICFMPYLSISVVVNGTAFPYYCRLPTVHAKAKTAENVFSLIAVLTVAWCAGLVLFANDIVLLGVKWAPAAGAVRFLAIYAFFLSMILTALQVLKVMGRTDLVFMGRLLHLALLTGLLAFTIHAGITVVALDQAVAACAIAVVCAAWTVRYGKLRWIALVQSAGLPVLCGMSMAAVVFVARLIPAARASNWGSLLTLGGLSLAVYAATALIAVPQPFRSGWAALRGRSDGAPQTPPQPDALR
jgi:O-antigen/teichoic acid export membrane protein